jgi:hypothetical protein
VTIGNHIPDTMLNSAPRGELPHAKDSGGSQRLKPLPRARLGPRGCSLRHLRSS